MYLASLVGVCHAPIEANSQSSVAPDEKRDVTVLPRTPFVRRWHHVGSDHRQLMIGPRRSDVQVVFAVCTNACFGGLGAPAGVAHCLFVFWRQVSCAILALVLNCNSSAMVEWVSKSTFGPVHVFFLRLPPGPHGLLIALLFTTTPTLVSILLYPSSFSLPADGGD